jgi:hypothetical protein
MNKNNGANDDYPHDILNDCRDIFERGDEIGFWEALRVCNDTRNRIRNGLPTQFETTQRVSPSRNRMVVLHGRTCCVISGFTCASTLAAKITPVSRRLMRSR